jgi:ribosomal protein S18 acetylase RimI-like enzyme
MEWRRLTPGDLARVSGLADHIHRSHLEDREVFANRLRFYPAGCWVLAEEREVAGYVISHPWVLHSPPPLNTLLPLERRDFDTYYLHDIAIAADLRRQGWARKVTLSLLRHGARTFATASMVSVNATGPLWRRFGFEIVESDALRPKLASYGIGARYMVADLAPYTT